MSVLEDAAVHRLLGSIPMSDLATSDFPAVIENDLFDVGLILESVKLALGEIELNPSLSEFERKEKVGDLFFRFSSEWTKSSRGKFLDNAYRPRELMFIHVSSQTRRILYVHVGCIDRFTMQLHN